MTEPAIHRVVYDCNVLFQALLSPAGPAGGCVTAALEQRVVLSASRYVIDELRDVASRPVIRSKFRHLTDQRLADFVDSVVAVAEFPASVPEVFDGCRDPDDNHYLNLAIATRSVYVVSRDKDLLALTDRSHPPAQTLAALFPELRIVEPVQMLAVLGEDRSHGGDPGRRSPPPQRERDREP